VIDSRPNGTPTPMQVNGHAVEEERVVDDLLADLLTR
jgi:hypothetical protein